MAVRTGDGGDACGLVPLSRLAAGNAAEAAKLERLQGAWPLLVGPGLGRHTHPISIANGLLLIGCHDTFALASMRASAESAWPELRGRIAAMVGAHMRRVEVTPSDPPDPAPARRRQGGARAAPAKADPLDAVLELYEARRGR